ncbi:hypothetical protein Lfu02_69510 [Longispora fulva]|uniref:Bacterial mobilisation domain-containing protein n=1 Tax=Longispora fulva TaxID=619741 RepID=A0A8J7G7K2_9ACTN|nr:MobC family plasmid mobilization relaxosome protein [Longispora fulva]MBG6134510.1 hypothetical protein [Longispora fulva]GIG62579.1 hypothetical protein Lfu02_69510 [Longispora fulva]
MEQVGVVEQFAAVVARLWEQFAARQNELVSLESQVRGIGTNINQLAKVANSTEQAQPVPDELVELYFLIRQATRELSASLSGQRL